MSCSCDVRRCALGYYEDVSPRARYVGGASQVTCPNPGLHEEHHEVDIYTPSFNRFALSESRRTRRKNA